MYVSLFTTNKSTMILKHVHLFGILLLSLLLASFLGKFLNNGKSKEGLFEDGSDDSGYDGLTAPINTHTGGSSVAIETFSFSSPDDQRRHLQEESAHTPQSSITTTTAATNVQPLAEPDTQTNSSISNIIINNAFVHLCVCERL